MKEEKKEEIIKSQNKHLTFQKLYVSMSKYSPET